jgi:multiple sugar transport system permease protein
LAAYSLARLRPRGSGVILRSILAIAVFPTIVLLLPLYQLLRQLGLLGTPFCLILCYTTINMPFVVWVLTSFFSEIPEEIEDAARVDGFSRLGIWARVIIPLSAPALATTAILVFIFSWNEFLLAHTFVGETEWATIPVALSRIGGSTAHDVPINAISAGVVLSTLPLVVAVVILQRKIVEGLTAGAVKG